MDKIEKLMKFIGNFESIAVSFSGGVDSSTLLALSSMKCERVIGVTVVTQATPKREIRNAKKIASSIGVKHEIIHLDILSDEFVKNDLKRCYYCKKRMFEKIAEYSKENDYEAIFEGTNADELKSFRPGFEAIREFKNVYSPFVIFNIKRNEIERIAKEMGFDFYKKPPQSCLATRIPFGYEITKEKLERIDLAEEKILEITDVNQVRVRDFEKFAVIEVGREEIKKLFDEVILSEILNELKNLGYEKVFLDIEGYKSLY